MGLGLRLRMGSLLEPANPGATSHPLPTDPSPLEMAKEAVPRQGWSAASIEGGTALNCISDQSSPERVCLGRTTYERFE